MTPNNEYLNPPCVCISQGSLLLAWEAESP